MGERFEQIREWWECQDSETRYLVIIGVSGALSVLAALFTPRENFHRVRLEP